MHITVSYHYVNFPTYGRASLQLQARRISILMQTIEYNIIRRSSCSQNTEYTSICVYLQVIKGFRAREYMGRQELKQEQPDEAILMG